MYKIKVFIISIFFLFSFLKLDAQTFNLDSTYGIAGAAYTFDHCRNSLLLSDNKLIVASELSYFFDESSPKMAIIKYNEDGSKDNSFGVNGTTTYVAPDLRFNIYAITAQEDGKIIVCGTVYPRSFGYYYDFFMLRFNANGTIDSSFGTNGLVKKSINNFNGLEERFISVAVDKNGKILASGFSQADANSKTDAVAMRFLSNGNIDTSFATNGILMLNLVDNDSFSKIKVLSDNTIIVAGKTTISNYNEDIILMKLNENGIPDTTFGTNAMTSIDFNSGLDSLTELYLLPNNKIMLIGNSNGSIAFARLNGNGILDTSFSGDGKNTIYISIPNHYSAGVNCVARSLDNKYLIFSNPKRNDDSTNNYDLVVARINEDTTFDTSFANNGIFINETRKISEYANGIHFQNDGKILLLAYWWDSTSSAGNIYRYLNGNTLSIAEENNIQKDVKILSNPTETTFGVLSEEEIQKVEIFNIEGKKIKVINYVFNEIDISTIDKGIYFLKIYINDKVAYKKIIKK
jgi:uncharacterized delta-60 repeat protein